MSNQRAMKKQMMKFRNLSTKKVEHFFKKGEKVGTRITSMVGQLKIESAPGKRCEN